MGHEPQLPDWWPERMAIEKVVRADAAAAADPRADIVAWRTRHGERGQRLIDAAEPTVEDYTDRHPATHSGTWIEWHEHVPTMVVAFTDDLERHARALQRPGVRVTRGERSMLELERMLDDIFGREPPAGARWSTGGLNTREGTVEVDAMGPDEGAVAAWLRERYGEAVRLTWLGPAAPLVEPVPWHVWQTSPGDPCALVVKYETNSAYTFERVDVEETADAVRVTVFESQPRGFVTMAAQTRSAGVRLREPVGTRQVIDTVTGRTRSPL